MIAVSFNMNRNVMLVIKNTFSEGLKLSPFLLYLCDLFFHFQDILHASFKEKKISFTQKRIRYLTSKTYLYVMFFLGTIFHVIY